MVHFDIDGRYQDELIVGSAISRREGVVFSVVFHVVVLLALAFGPSLDVFRPSLEELEARQRDLQRQQELEQAKERFVFIQPQVDLRALTPPSRAELSDLDRQAQSRERADQPANPLPFSRGNSSERVIQPPERAEEGESREAPSPEPPRPEPEERVARATPPIDNGTRPAPQTSPKQSGTLSDALRNLQRYVQNETFHNPQGGDQNPGAQIQFDSKGVEFGPWLRRFVAQVRRNWFVPYAAMTFRGKVVLQFNIHKDGRITDISVAGPSNIDAFNHAAYNAILGSNPTEPLPPEYPDSKAFFTVTFYYNEQPPIQ